MPARLAVVRCTEVGGAQSCEENKVSSFHSQIPTPNRSSVVTLLIDMYVHNRE